MATPTLAERRLARRMRQLRESAGFTAQAVEATHILSRRSLGRLERAESIPNWPTVTELATLYGADAKLRALLKELAIKSHELNWADRFKGAVPPEFSLLFELEQDAISIDTYEPELITGLLQTPDYRRAVIEASPLIAEEQRPLATSLRSRRRTTVLPDGGGGPKLRVLLTEGAVTRVIGSPSIHADALASLRDDAARPNVEIRVLPSSVGAYGALVGPYAVLRFDDPLDPPVVYVESLAVATYHETTEVVTAYSTTFDASWIKGEPV